MKINLENKDHNSVIIAMEVVYQAIADLVMLYKQINDEVLKQLAIFEGKSIKEVKREITTFLLLENKEKEYLLKIKASQNIINRYNNDKEK
jgi:hypothetical protein